VNEKLKTLVDSYADVEPKNGYHRLDQFPLSNADILTMVEADPDVLCSLFDGPQDEREKAIKGLRAALALTDPLDLHVTLGAVFGRLLKATCQRELMYLVDRESLRRDEPTTQLANEKVAANRASMRLVR
jgi:hypothetical protein